MSGKSSPKSSTPSSLTPRSTPPRMTPVRTSPPRGTTPTRLQASRAALSAAPPPANGHLHAHSLSMLGAERYQNQLFTTANAELFNGKKKTASMYRRPSELGLATTPMEDKSEIKSKFQPMAGGRQHIVKPIPDHKETYQAAVEEWKEENVKETESTSHYKNLGAKRPVCQKLYDHLTLGATAIKQSFENNMTGPDVEGEIEKESLVRETYKDLQAKRPICQRLIDHTEEIQPKLNMDETSEYRSTINKLEGLALKGDRVLPPWLNMQKVTPFGTNQDTTRE